MDTVVLIPAYHPDEKLIVLLRTLTEKYVGLIPLVVDDGSGQEYEELFHRAKTYGTVLRHEENRGKGAAIKTGITYVKKNLPQVAAIVTADADGQHLPEDIRHLADELGERPGFVIGARKFEGKVPLRSRFGNEITKLVFLVAAGKKCSDTQTGLRGFSADLFDFMLHIKGNRYEYEMNVLMQCAQNGVGIREIPIRTVYEGGKNETSHFRPLLDSFRIYKTIFINSSLIRYGLSAVFCFLIDFGAMSVFQTFITMAWLYTLLARCISAPVNYAINRRFVFNSDANKAASFISYITLAVLVIVVKMGLMTLLVDYLHWNYAVSDILVEVVLFITNFIIQKLFIFRKKRMK